jgi:GTP pyrophosphokinase
MQYEDLIKAMNQADCYDLEDYRKVGTAFAFAERLHHKGEPRKSGEPYITHPVAVACTLANQYSDDDTLCAGLLHDTVEDIPGVTDQLIAEQFGDTTAFLVDGVTKIRKNENDDIELNREANLKKIMESIPKDIRIIQIKLADRKHNMQTMEYMKPEKQIYKSQETRDIYVPIATLIGEYEMKTELEDLAFMYLHPKEYEEMIKITREIEIKEQHNKDIVLNTIIMALLKVGIEPKLEARIKNPYGIYRRLQKYGSLSEIHDLYSIKIIIDDVEQLLCMKEYISSLFEIVPGKSKNYIVSPKTNGYRADHVTVRTYDGSMMQLQFVTSNMDKVNRSGITASYQELRKQKGNNYSLQDRVKNMQFYKTLEFLKEANLSPSEYNKAVRQDVLTKMVYIEDQDREVTELPLGSTPIDYALAKDIDIRKIWKILVNGKVVPPNYQLESKDSVKIVKAYEEKDAIPLKIIASNASCYKSKLKIKGMYLH